MHTPLNSLIVSTVATTVLMSKAVTAVVVIGASCTFAMLELDDVITRRHMNQKWTVC